MKVNKPGFHKSVPPHLSVARTPWVSCLGHTILLLVSWEQGENMVGNFIIQFPDFYLDPCFEHQPHTVSSLLFSFFSKDFIIIIIFFFWCGPFFNVFIEFVAVLLMLYVLVCWLSGMWDLSSMTGDQACTHCIGRQSLNPWTAREVHSLCLYNFSTITHALQPWFPDELVGVESIVFIRW